MTRKKILLVDDQNTVLMMERMMLKEGGFEIFTARDGEEALVVAREKKPDLILLDVIMPKMGGFDTCRALRAREETQATPIILCTTRGEATNMQAGFDAGCTDYVTKPFNAVELLAKIRSHLAK